MNEQNSTSQGGFLGTWNSLTLRQQISALIATGLVIFGCVFIVNIANRVPEALLFSGLEGGTAGDIAAELDSLGVDYSVRGSAIYVPETERDRLRIEMARLGLPAANGAGYELLDNLNGFSTTADMFDAAYWRAKEGELTRTIVAMPSVRTARVHLGVTRNSAFRRGRNDKSASVTVDAPLALTGEQAKSIQYLTALAVPDLLPENVAVIDTQRGVIAGPGGPGDQMAGTDEASREEALSARLTQLLEAHVGPGNAEVSVALELDRSSVAETQRIIDPDSRQISSRDLKEERDTESTGQGIVTVASNLPDGELEQPDADSHVLRTKRDEKTVYTGTETERVTQQLPGSIMRMSIAVLINERYTEDAEGNPQLDPRSPEELAALETLIARAAGIDEARGDLLTVQILPFEMPPEMAAFTPPGFVEEYVLPQAVETAQMVFMGLIVLVVGLFILKPLLTPRRPALGTGEENAAPSIESMDAASLLTMLTRESPEDAAAILDDWFEKEADAA